MKKKLIFIIVLAVFGVSLIVSSSIILSDYIGNNISDELKIKLDKEKNQTIISLDGSSKVKTKIEEFSESEKLRYDEIINLKFVQDSDIITFTKALNSEKTITVNGNTKKLTYYYTENIYNNNFYKNPDNVNLTISRDVYIDNNNEAYKFGTQDEILLGYNSLHSKTRNASASKFTPEQVKVVVKDFIKNFRKLNDDCNLEVGQLENGRYRVYCQGKIGNLTVFDLDSEIDEFGNIRWLVVSGYQGELLTNEQIELTDKRLDDYIKSNYEKIKSYEFQRVAGLANGVPVIYYSVVFTDDDEPNASQFVDIIVIKVAT